MTGIEWSASEKRWLIRLEERRPRNKQMSGRGGKGEKESSRIG